MMNRTMTLGAALLVAVGTIGASADPREIGDTQVFTVLPADGPGMPEGIAVRGDTVYVGTHVSIRGNAGGPPSRVYTFDRTTGMPTGEIVIQGQDQSVNHGILAMAFDAAGRLYVVDRNPGRIVRIDLETQDQETYATIPNLPACRPLVGPEEDCSPTVADSATFADYMAFAPDGSAYVTDLEAATIFRVPPGGGAAEIWYQDARFDGVFGLNGIAVDRDQEYLYFAMTGSQQPTTPAQGIIYRLPLTTESPAAADLEEFFVYLEPASGPDGLAFGTSGKLYVALAGSNQVSILNPDGTEAARFPDAVSNQFQEVPFDLPASVAFDGDGSLLVTNQSFFTAVPEHWVVFDVWVDDTALPLIEPAIP